MKIRIMTIDDYEKVYALWLSTPSMGLNYIDDSIKGFNKYLDRNPCTCFVAEKGNDIVGCILSGHDGRRGFIYHLAVSQSTQLQGVGTALVDAAVLSLKNQGINKVALVAFKENENGNAFWEKMGFMTRDDLVYRNKALTEIPIIDTQMD